MLIIPPVTVGVCAALLATADRFLCNDTGLMHVAGAVSVPTLALFGPTNPDLWKPRTPDCVHLQADSKRLADIDADAVWHNWSTLESGIIREG
jgi:ADP-heptose:LPS heptosyltransferase